MEIRKLRSNETPPMDLLLLADPSRKMIEEYLTSGHCYVAIMEKVMMGVYVTTETNPETVEIANIAVMYGKQGRGIGKKLVKHAINNARTRGFTKIEIGTGNSSIGQLALYQKCGFRIVGILKDFFTKNYPEKIIENGIVCRDMIRLEMDLRAVK
ncbi:GNAT family N-acetyltransferase [Lentibacillus sp. Marseille-P4043]|uniref:GNAT family N-acetyltransferase n=1 Tax=Lentibacillus sp. Marseille-P4043 TaxID=2040293 RepID=UPI000D0B2572|nr:GNAT family N-acetyltransferase [Lentibacillus sp. Marseille-P4043]